MYNDTDRSRHRDTEFHSGADRHRDREFHSDRSPSLVHLERDRFPYKICYQHVRLRYRVSNGAEFGA
jgi:hypothetical protein